MEHKEHKLAEATEDEVTPDPNTQERPVGSAEWEELLEESERMSADQFEQRVAGVAEVLDLLKCAVTRVEERLANLNGRSSRVEEHIERLRIDDQVLTEMHERNRELTEEFHEREVLQPVFLALIGIIDRCDQMVQEIDRTIRRHRDSGTPTGLTLLKSICEARKGDLIELESVLAHLGVERFESVSEVFDPVTQTCVQRVTNLDSGFAGRLAYRMLPGYRRGERIVRQERVAVYVAAEPMPPKQKGA